MKGARVVVVGASAGIGRAFATACADAGADVVAAARRGPVVADVCTEDGRSAIAAACGDRVDLLLHTVGRAELAGVAATGEDAWRSAFETNVIGLNRLVAALVDRLAPGAIVAALSSETATAPWPGLAAYAASKAALGSSMRSWQLEHPGLRFSLVDMGPATPTEFGDGFDPTRLGAFYKQWERHARMRAEYIDTDEVARVLVGVYAVALANPSVNVERIVLRSPSDVA